MRALLIATTTLLSLFAVSLASAQQTRLNAEGVTVKIGDSVYAVGFDVLPLPGIRGFPFPRSANTLKARVVFGGQLGVAAVPTGRNLEGRVFILLPPSRPADGDPDYQVWTHADLIARYRGAAAIAIVSLDLTPLTVVHSVMEWRTDASGQERSSESPPVLIISRAAANAMLGAEISTLRVGTANDEVQIKFNVQTKQ